MGRKKIQISKITDERNRQVTFNKRKFGVMKKAYELSVLCDCEIALIIFSSSNKLYQYASTDMDKVLLKYTEYNEPHESLTNKNIIEKENKNGTMSPDSPEPEDSYSLTPRTEAKYNKIDEDFQMIMQRNPQLTGGRINMASNFNLPVSVPVGGTYGEPSNMIQTSPQVIHQSISPRPSSSETDSDNFSAYPSGTMLEISNGYPHSSSPVVGSPSPGPSPSINSKSLHKQHSPSTQSGRNLRVVIPTQMSTGISSDDVYTEHNRQTQHNIQTPVVALQTPIPGLTSYQLGTFGAQDFSMTSSDLNILSSWNPTIHQSAHGNIPHLAMPSNTPPPALSPASVKIKSEPISPPRDMLQPCSSGGGSITSGQTTTTLTTTNLSSNNSIGNSLQTHQHLIVSSGSRNCTQNLGSLTPTSCSSPGDTRSNSGISNNSTQAPNDLSDYETGSTTIKRPRISDGWET
ncbi:myocyte-specific enhancer factor 2 [Culicoides brevitarsis]|uniref:myocyte-specific enhancer factor 2 n=1 Tax=Culicoides brevitarsis TaxID=469753 RepID=UPI00307BC740